MTLSTALSRLVLTAALMLASAASAQEAAGLHVVKYDINAESENAELCLEFDKPLASTPANRLGSAFHLDLEGKTTLPSNVVSAGTSLCLFPLERGKSYHLEVTGLKAAEDVKMTAPYKLAFTIPDRSPTLAFTGDNGGVNSFDFYDHPLTLRAVNVRRAKIEIYRVTDVPLLARAWQDRAQTALAPTESAYVARTKGRLVWSGETFLDTVPNATTEQQIALRQRAPGLPPGLYLIVADAGNGDAKPANKGLAPLAAAWFTHADFKVRALRDREGIHIFASEMDSLATKDNLDLIILNKKPEQIAEAKNSRDGVSFIALAGDTQEVASLVALDNTGGVAFADVETLPTLASQPALGDIRFTSPFATPGQSVDLLLSTGSNDDMKKASNSSLVRATQGERTYGDFLVPVFTQDTAKVPFIVPAFPGPWMLHWQRADGASIASQVMNIATSADLPHLTVSSQRDTLVSDSPWPVTIRSVSSTGKPIPLAGGNVFLTWQKLDPTSLGWHDYQFGMTTAILDAPVPITTFMTDVQGTAQLRLTLPKAPPDHGLYQASLTVKGEADSGMGDAAPLTVALHSDNTVVGVKPLSKNARFPQNGLARFSVIALGTDGKPRDIVGLSYQLYEEGRHFSWFQDDGRWKYKPASQLRPIGGGALSIRADGTTVLEWPVTAGNYRLEILDQGGKALTQATFSASWDSTGTIAAPTLPLTVIVPKTFVSNHEVRVHVLLTKPAMLTTIIADDDLIHQVVHEFRDKGDNVISFTPLPDWKDTLSVSTEAVAQGSNVPMSAVEEMSLSKNPELTLDQTSDALSVTSTDPTSGFAFFKDGRTSLRFGVSNNSAGAETYHFAFSASPGVSLTGDDKGEFTLKSLQSRSLTLSVASTVAGVKEVRLDITGQKTPKTTRTWNVAVLPRTVFQSSGTTEVSSKNTLTRNARAHSSLVDTLAIVARNPMDGLPEMLSSLVNMQPFSTAELALNTDALRLWEPTVAQLGVAPDFVVSARHDEWLSELLRHQNIDGGFGAYRDGESTIDDTAYALLALGPDTSLGSGPARTQAIAWVKQRLANTWVDERERGARAAAYAGLAAADALDPASLHYFSDTSASAVLPPLAEINIAAAFKKLGDPNAAAFWIKKMLDQNGRIKSVALLNALAATDALSSDDVHAAMALMKEIRANGRPVDARDVAGLLRAIWADNVDAGKGHLTNGSDIRDVRSVLVVHSNDLATYHNNDAQPLYATMVNVGQAPVSLPVSGTTITRHVYRLNGVELASPAVPLRSEAYMIELKGNVPSLSANEQVLIQDSSDALHPLGCPLSPKMEPVAFIPWFTPSSLTNTTACTFSSHAMNAVLGPLDSDNGSFSLVYFAQIDANSLSSVRAPQLRLLR